MSKRYWAFRDMHFNFEGFYIPDIYKALWNFVSDRGHGINEWKYAHNLSADAKGQGCVGVWLATNEIERKYALGGHIIRWKFVWSPTPKPGSSGENPPMVPKGRADVWIHGFIVTDYLNAWGNSLLLRPLFALRDRYFYRKKRLILLDKMRQEAEEIFKDLQEFVSFLPTIK